MQPPRIDPGPFRNETDAKVLAAGIAWKVQVANHPVLKKSLGARVQPASDVSLETEEERIEHMRVKGLESLRVIDASVFPGHVSGNIMTTAYAVAEKGRDLVTQADGRYLAKVDSKKGICKDFA